MSRTRVNMSPAGTIHLIHDRDGNVIAETDGAGNTVREYVWLQEAGSAAGATGTNGIPLPLAVISAVNTATPVTYFVHADHLNRPVAMTGATKQVVWSASYLPFGGEYQITGPASLDARFPGQWFQMESGLAYNWHRHYDASLGRYTQPDPLGFVDGPSRYAYAVNSPQGNVDPDGRIIVDWNALKFGFKWFFNFEPPANDNELKPPRPRYQCRLIREVSSMSCPPQKTCQYQCQDGYVFSVTLEPKYQLCDRTRVDPRELP